MRCPVNLGDPNEQIFSWSEQEMGMSMVVKNILTNVNKYFLDVIISGLPNPLKQMLTGIVCYNWILFMLHTYAFGPFEI